MKLCRRCKIEKPLEEFSKWTRSPDGKQIYCKLCVIARRNKWVSENYEKYLEQNRARYLKNPEEKKARAKAWYWANKERHFFSRILREYDLSKEAYLGLVEEQGGKCACCGETKPLEVDHCHVSDTVRGLLCGDCNKMVGFAKDNKLTLISAFCYLSKKAKV